MHQSRISVKSTYNQFRGKSKVNSKSNNGLEYAPVEDHIGWGAIKTLSAMDEFRNLDRDIENNSKRWRKFVEAEAPEKEKFPQV